MRQLLFTFLFILPVFSGITQERAPLRADRTLQDVLRREREIKYDNLKASLKTTLNDSAKVDLLINMSYLLQSNLDEVKLSRSHLSEAKKLAKNIRYKEGLKRANRAYDFLIMHENYWKNRKLNEDLDQANLIIENTKIEKSYSVAIAGLLFIIVMFLGYQNYHFRKTNKVISDEGNI